MWPGAVVEPADEFLAFVRLHQPTLQRTFSARYGTEIGAEVSADALAWAWEHQREITEAVNPGGYLFRVGQSRARRYLRWRRPPLPDPPPERRDGTADVELHEALRRLRPEQRGAVIMVHAFGYSYRDAAEHTGVTEAALRNHLHRGMTRLRELMENGDAT